MDITIEDRSGVKVAVVAGEIDGSTSSRLERAVAPFLQEDTRVVLDLGRTTFVSSAGLRALLLLYREARARRARLALAGASRDVKEVMSSTGFLRFFRLTETVEDAVSLVGAPSASGPASARSMTS
ncbi:STAS domain-containing protein [Sorangium sp. So ce388]|uniref:STAS domain-containing protein n=1 Tax=Sorangium sp. So ce388 TaxID=3133309 RepID=UPI003F5C0F44